MFAARNLSGCWGKALQELCSMQHSRLIFFLYVHKTHRLNPLPLTFLQSQTSTNTLFSACQDFWPPPPPPNTSDLLPTPLKRKDRNNLHRKLIIFTVPVLISAWTPQKLKYLKKLFCRKLFCTEVTILAKCGHAIFWTCGPDDMADFLFSLCITVWLMARAALT